MSKTGCKPVNLVSLESKQHNAFNSMEEHALSMQHESTKKVLNPLQQQPAATVVHHQFTGMDEGLTASQTCEVVMAGAFSEGRMNFHRARP